MFNNCDYASLTCYKSYSKGDNTIIQLHNMAEPQLASLMSRFQGCLIGALVGDCFGAPFEFSKSGLDFVKRFVNKVETSKFLLL